MKIKIKKLGAMVEAKTEARVETEQGYSYYWERDVEKYLVK